MANIYQQIWNSDRHKLLVSPRDSAGNWLDPEADILLDEQIGVDARQRQDLATKPLFAWVNESKLTSHQTYTSFFQLLDNYKFDNQKSEIVTRAERQEVASFITEICQTQPLQIAYQYITKQLKFALARTDFPGQLTSIWFELFTNYFGDLAIADASGFEHVFVGEGKYQYDELSNKITGAISGYHSWIKFYLDEKQGRVDYLGHNYQLEGSLGTDNPYVATVQMRWQERSNPENIPIELFKKKGCFFIGTSPECELAMGTVAFYEHLANHRFKDEKREIIINGDRYKLALYRNIKRDGSRGHHVRSFYPIYLGKG